MKNMKYQVRLETGAIIAASHSARGIGEWLDRHAAYGNPAIDDYAALQHRHEQEGKQVWTVKENTEDEVAANIIATEGASSLPAYLR